MKRKKGEARFYAVKSGKQPGVYSTWSECQEQIKTPGSLYKAFPSIEEANDWILGRQVKTNGKPDRFYAVAVGNKPGIYTDWEETQQAYKGVKQPKYKKFDTRVEAVTWMQTIRAGQASITRALQTVDDESDEEAEAEAALEATRPSKRLKVQDTSKPAAVAKTSVAPKDAELSGLLPIYTDGSSLSNGKASAAAGYGVFFGPGDARNISERLQGDPQTNQRAELTAILRALEAVPHTQPIEIFSDSTYSIKCVTEWFMSWQRNNWQTKAGPVKNKDLVQQILRVLEARHIAIGRDKTKFTWVKAHDTDAWNNAVDELAKAGARMPL